MNGRNQNGRFAIGNRGGPGRPPRLVEATYLETLKTNVTQADLAEIVGGLVERAKAGDTRSIDLLFRHVLPTPQQRMELEVRAPAEEFRVAGMTPDEVDKRMLKLLSDTVRVQRQQKAQEAAQAAVVGAGPGSVNPRHRPQARS